MIFVTLPFYCFVLVLLALYYLFPLKSRWTVLLAGSLGFYAWLCPAGLAHLTWAILTSYGCGILLGKLRAQSASRKKQLLALWLGIALVLIPLLVIKEGDFLLALTAPGEGSPVFRMLSYRESGRIFIPLGISFYTLQIIGYLTDVFKGKISCQKNLCKYALFVSFFPQIVQGPIPRYDQMEQLWEGHPFAETTFTKGFHLILYGFFLKLVLADRLAPAVATVFNDLEPFGGWFVIIAGVLYSIQLYTDFEACVCISRGTASLFGIQLQKNFRQPYFSQSIQEFWQRWHRTLSLWFRDYIYIPLGGNRKGAAQKWCNLFIVFFVSGMWHGCGVKFLLWGLLHGVFQLIGGLTKKYREKAYGALHLSTKSAPVVLFRRLFTFGLVTLGWIVFRANSLGDVVTMVTAPASRWSLSALLSFRPGLIGLRLPDCALLLLALAVLFLVDRAQYKEKAGLSDRLLAKPFPVRLLVYLAAIFFVLIFGSYGYGFTAQDFIYGGF